MIAGRLATTLEVHTILGVVSVDVDYPPGLILLVRISMMAARAQVGSDSGWFSTERRRQHSFDIRSSVA